MKIRILALVLAACLVLGGCGAKTVIQEENAAATLQEVTGDWHLDGDYTQEKSGMSLEDFYGAVWQDENILQFRQDGTMYYKAGMCYGNGKYRITERGIRVEFAGEEDEDDAGFTLLILERDDGLRIGMDQYGDGTYVYWSTGSSYEKAYFNFGDGCVPGAGGLRIVLRGSDPAYGTGNSAGGHPAYPAGYRTDD